MEKTEWTGSVPRQCQFCKEEFRDTFIDGNTMYGWAYMCVPCHSMEGVGFGLGAAQQYELKESGRWLKTKG